MFSRRVSTVLASAAAMVMLTGTAASAHECFVVNRSEKSQATNGQWTAITPTILATDLLGLTGDAAACFVAQWTVQGGPAQVVVFNKRTLPAKKPADGKGIDHAEDVYGPLVGSVLVACGLVP